MTVTLIEGIAAFIAYLFGGALVLFIYEAYAKTGQRSLMYMAAGFFVVIFGGNLNTLVMGISDVSESMNISALTDIFNAVDLSIFRTFSLVIQILGILILLFSATNPFSAKE